MGARRGWVGDLSRRLRNLILEHLIDLTEGETNGFDALAFALYSCDA